MNILYFSPISWHFIRQRPQHLALELSRNHDVVYFYPRNLIQCLKDWLRRPKSESLFPLVTRKVNRGLTLYQPVALPHLPVAICSNLNLRIYRLLLKRFIRRKGLSDFVVWLSHPRQADCISLFRGKVMYYDCMDSWRDFNLGREKELVDSEEDRILSEVSAAFASSRYLVERMRKRCGRVHHIPNAAEVEHFSQAVKKNLPVPSGLKNLRRPLIGYVGTVAEWHDIDLITFAARQRGDFDFVLVGPVGENADIRGCDQVPNLHFLGATPYQELPNYLQHIDVCILPFRTGDFCRSIDPVKAYEYLAAGKQVVATDMPELDKFGDLIKVAGDRTQFVESLELCLQEIKSGRHDPLARLKTVENHSWRSRGREIERILVGSDDGI